MNFNKVWGIVHDNRNSIIKHFIALVIFYILSLILSLLPLKDARFSEPEDMELSNSDGLFTAEELAKFDGISDKKLYLAVLGSVFDVSKGLNYYAKGGPYNYFVGKDGSRSLVTGDFKDESDNKDNVIDLTCADLKNVLNWRSTYKEKYTHIGFLVGRYYNKNGKERVYHKELYHRLKQCEEDNKAIKEHEKRYPPCNIAWSADKGSEVWCTNTSGGISRNWVGVPRQMYIPGKEKPHCVCVNLDHEAAGDLKQFKAYENCHDTSTSCIINVN